MTISSSKHSVIIFRKEETWRRHEAHLINIKYGEAYKLEDIVTKKLVTISGATVQVPKLQNLYNAIKYQNISPSPPTTLNKMECPEANKATSKASTFN